MLIQVHIVRLSYRHAIQYHFDRLNLLEISRIIKKKYGFYHFSDNGTQKNSSAATMRLQITELFFGGPIGPIVYSCIKIKAHHCLPQNLFHSPLSTLSRSPLLFLYWNIWNKSHAPNYKFPPKKETVKTSLVSIVTNEIMTNYIQYLLWSSPLSHPPFWTWLAIHVT